MNVPLSSIYRHLAEVRSGCRAIQHDLSVAHVARIIPVCERLKNAARSMAEEFAAKAMQAAADAELEYVSSPRLLSLIFFAHTGRMGSGRMAPWFTALVLGINLPSEPDLFGCGYKFWEPIPNPLRDKAALEAAVELAEPAPLGSAPREPERAPSLVRPAPESLQEAARALPAILQAELGFVECAPACPRPASLNRPHTQ